MNAPAITRPNTQIQQLNNTSIHNWYRFVLSYPDHLVSDLLNKFDVQPGDIVLDPFVGTGTTLVECKRRGINSIGIDANPVTAFASKVKTTWDIDLKLFDERFQELRQASQSLMQTNGIAHSYQLSLDDLLFSNKIVAESEEFNSSYEVINQLLPPNWISPKPLQKCLIFKKIVDAWPGDNVTDLFRLALATVLVNASNLGFGPEVYVAKKRIDADVYHLLTTQLYRMRYDLDMIQQLPLMGETMACVGDARKLTEMVTKSVDFVICSPPYPNEKDYTRITRLELILLEFMRSKTDLRTIKENMLRSHTRNIYSADNDSVYITDLPEIQQVAQEIEIKRIERNATSGFERLYHRVVTEYFGGMYRVLEQMQQITSAGAKLAFVVGDQMSYFQVPICTSHLLSLIACQKLRYRELETRLWRTRKATTTKKDVAEYILILERC